MRKQALISVSDKTGVASFARELVNLGYHILSTGGNGKTPFRRRHCLSGSGRLHRFSGDA